MSAVSVLLGTIDLSDHVTPPSFETYTGASGPPSGSGVKAVPTIWLGFRGLTASVGSLSWFTSSLSERGIMLTTSNFPPLGRAVRPGFAIRRRTGACLTRFAMDVSLRAALPPRRRTTTASVRRPLCRCHGRRRAQELPYLLDRAYRLRREHPTYRHALDADGQCCTR